MVYEEVTSLVLRQARDGEFLISERASPSQFVFNVGSYSEGKKRQALYAIKFLENKDVCLIWDYKKHREKGKECGAAQNSLSLKGWGRLETGRDVFYPQYKHLGTKKVNGIWIYEKVYVVGSNHLQEFLENYEYLMELNSEDKEYPPDCISDGNWHNETERKKYASQQYRRSITFRTEVMAAYGSQCAICRCDIKELLQAAHERKYEHALTGSEDSKHGICLCANHHLMYDRHLIDIDLKNLKVVIHDKRLTQMPWYMEFKDIYGCRILERNDTRGQQG